MLLNKQFHTLCILKTVDCRHERKWYKWKVPNEGTLWTDDIRNAHRFILHAGVGFIRIIMIGKGMCDELGEEERLDMIGDFLVSCNNVRSLSVFEKYGQWASALPEKLERLEVMICNQRGAILKYCPCLRELNFETDRNHHRPHPEMNRYCIGWDAVGSRLERVVLGSFSYIQDELERIRKHTTK